ncbi:DUF418 domain-containing protein [Maritalea sp.]|jgi:uncharacterized membrane protein YeiB|uniref:DUF418 domain-containing protein n=1 Tax=Maritalea sp. TaxID=2003361 RepID=UPI0039E55168
MKNRRIQGLDLARFFAFAGMVVVNFQVVMRAPQSPSISFLADILAFLEGKAAATFVVLAGIGVSLAYQQSVSDHFHAIMLKRAGFLLGVGLVNMLVFDADIIHYYAFYFAIGIWLLPLSRKALLGATSAIILTSPALMLVFNYDAGWDWNTLSYSGFWTPMGFISNLFFNGWHPVVPWLAFFSFGIFLAKLDLSTSANAIRMAIFGTAGLMIVTLLSAVSVNVLTTNIGADAAAIFSTSPIPPGPLYMLNGISTAMLVIGFCLMLPKAIYQNTLIKTLCQTGQQTLTLYIAHIVIGMSMLETFGLIGTTTAPIALWAAIEFVVISAIYVYFWRKRFQRGPLEEIMRRIAS